MVENILLLLFITKIVRRPSRRPFTLYYTYVRDGVGVGRRVVRQLYNTSMYCCTHYIIIGAK